MPVSTQQLSVLLRLLGEVLDLSPAERSAWLETVARSDLAQAAELSALLDQEARLDEIGFLSDARPHRSRSPVEP